MKNSNTIIFTSIVWVSFAFIACDKEPKENPSLPSPIYVPPPPITDAGLDFYLEVPDDTMLLSAQITTYDRNPHLYLWKQLSGPSIALIEQKDSIHTRVTHLVDGKYTFEFIVTNSYGASAKDVVNVFVQKHTLPGQTEVLFPGVLWNCPFGCGIEINCLTCYVPDNKPFKVYLRERKFGPWIEVIRDDSSFGISSNVYTILDNQLVIYSNEPPTEKVDIKILY